MDFAPVFGMVKIRFCMAPCEVALVNVLLAQLAVLELERFGPDCHGALLPPALESIKPADRAGW